tara:strand:+ start:262 stop:4761 length:4500 start_codon:yes stop_codon:yes gene_type:complete
MSKDELPSINDILGDSNLPSYKDFLEKKEELPSVEEYITESNQNTVEEETQTIENADGESFLEVIDVVKAPEWAELVRLVNDVRKDIPQIPEIKSYDDELSSICEQITQIQTNFSLLDAKSDKITDLSVQNEEFEGKLTEIESKIPEIPEIRYYDEDIQFIYDKITTIKEELNSLPEVKYYEEDLESLKSRIEQVSEAIPTFPDWVQEVQEVPDFSWIGKTFSLIDDDFNKVQGHLDIIREKIDYQVNELNDNLDKKEFELRVDVKNLTENFEQTVTNLGETRDKLIKEVKDVSRRIWEQHHISKDDDKKLKKSILSEQNKLKQSLQKEIESINEKSVKADESILKFFTDLKETVDTLPEVKYYDKDVSRIDEDILSIREELKEISQLASLIKTEQTQLKENYLLNEPSSEKQTAGDQTDPLTPLDQKFATLDDLSNHYRLFINRITTQLATLGGGGEVNLRYLDDIVGIATNLSAYDGMYLGIDASNSSQPFVFSPVSGGGVGAAGTWGVDSVGIHTTKSVGINTSSAVSGNSLYVVGDVEFTGNLSVGGTITKEDIKNLDSIGIITARSGITVTSNGLNVSGVSTISTGVGTVHIGVGQTTLLVDGDARVTGILTVGRGSITLDPSKKTLTGIDDILVGSGVSLSLAPLVGGSGKFVVDYSTINLKGYGSDLDGSYDRQSSSFVLTGAPSYSGSATFSALGGFYYFLHQSDNSKIIIYNLVDGYWSAIYVNGSNFSSLSNGQSLGSVTHSRFINPIRDFFDGTGRAYPAPVAGIEYATTISGRSSLLGIATATSLDVEGNTKITGITTINTGIGTVHVGLGNTALLVDGDARITGILTIGRSSVTIDGTNNTVSVGLVTVTNSTIVIGDNVTLDSGATGINSAPNVFYVAKDGSDSNNGTSIDNAKLTIAGAVGIAQSGSVIKVLSGNYVESNPIEIPAFVAVVGDDQRTVKVLPSNATQDIFHVNKGCKLANMTFSGHLAPAAAVAFPTGIATNVGGGKWKGPYIQNCTSDTTTGTGIYIDGDKAVKTKSMNVDAFTQYNQGGVGVAVTNEGYAQLVSVFTICCNEAITVHKGGQADLANSNCSFGTFGLVADGVSTGQFIGTVGITTSSGGSSTDYSEVTLSGLSPSSFNQTYTRQSTGFVLNTATAGSGSARIHADSNYYYYVASTGSANTNRALIFSEVDNKWVTIFTFSINFTEGNISDGQAIGSVFTDDVTASATTADGRNVPTASSDIVYATSGGGGGEVVGTGTATAGQDNVIVNVGAVTTRPYDGQVVYFDKLYKSVDSITITSGGSGYTNTPSVTISSPTGPNGEVATAFATLEDGVVTEIDIISSGSQYDPTDTVTVTISAPDSGTTATATASLADTYYTINSSTPISAGITTLTLAENLLNTVGVGSTAYFFQQSKIIASSHTFEYIGSGNDITTATPKRGGVTIQANEVVTQNGGSVIYTSTDQAGNFRIGDEFQINQNTGTISGRAFSKSLFSEMTPFILALS